MDDDVWFEPKRIGYGAGLPVRWQGWALVAGYLAAVAGLTTVLMPRHPMAYYLLVTALTAALCVIAARHTRGGWRWRWGGEA